MRRLPLLSEDVAVLRFVQLNAAARAYDAQRVQDFAQRAYRETLKSIAVAQLQMRGGDLVDAEVMSTIEENNDKLSYSHRAMERRAFIGLDHPVWSEYAPHDEHASDADYEPREPLCELYHNG